MAYNALQPWRYVGNSWQYTTIYDANDRTVCRLDLEDWDVTEDNQDELEKEQERVARIIAAAPELLGALERIVDSDMAQREEDEGNVSSELEMARSVIAKATGTK